MECITTDLTAVNLMKAFAGESQARNKYDLFADIAQEAGWHAVARHFREAAENEKCSHNQKSNSCYQNPFHTSYDNYTSWKL